jgi:hypothetical protein
MDLALIAGWHRRWLADGVLISPGDASGEWLRIRTRQRPLRAFRDVLGDAAVGPLERLATVEGEHAGIVAVHDPDEARVVAMIVADDSYVLVEARSADQGRADWLRDLVRTVVRFYPLGLGNPRLRRYVYRPPAGFQALQRAGSVCWLSPEFPRISCRITAYDARPLKWFAPGAVDRFLFVDENPFAVKDSPIAPTRVVSPAPVALAGRAMRATGRAKDGTPIAQVKTVLQDAYYYYAVQLDVRAEEWEAFVPTYEDVLRTIEPIPSSELKPSVLAFLHWSE